MSRKATPPMRNEATQRLKPPKVTTLAELARGTARRERLRTVAEGCEQLQTVANGCDTSIEYTLSTQTPRVTREPLLRIREQDTLPSHASQEMPRKILRSFFYPFESGILSLSLFPVTPSASVPTCSNTGFINLAKGCKRAKQFVHLYSSVV